MVAILNNNAALNNKYVGYIKNKEETQPVKPNDTYQVLDLTNPQIRKLAIEINNADATSLPNLFLEALTLYNDTQTSDALYMLYYAASKIRGGENNPFSQNTKYLEDALQLTQKHTERNPGDRLALILSGTIRFELAGVQRERNNWPEALRNYREMLNVYLKALALFPDLNVGEPKTQEEKIINQDTARIGLCLQDILARNPEPEQQSNIKTNQDYRYLVENLGFADNPEF
ncbi:MAG: hypothetical protein LBK68_06870 [Candidatus Margulisbacteria bacterium]|jgi:hypothetical protein|nr:hypothetical protein [Candidatus Margulisiibacteriota bacterium]